MPFSEKSGYTPYPTPEQLRITAEAFYKGVRACISRAAAYGLLECDVILESYDDREDVKNQLRSEGFTVRISSVLGKPGLKVEW